MKKLLSALSASLRLCVLIPLIATADEVKRDANGKIITVTTKNPGGGETVRDGNGKILEQKSPASGNTVTVRDSNGKILRTEKK